MFTPPRSNANKTELNQVNQQLFQALALAAGAQLEGLQQTRDTQVVLGALLQTEAQRLEKKYGADHSRVQQIDASRQRNAMAIEDLEVELELVTIRQPQVDDKSALVQGRVADQSRRAIPGLAVFLSNEKQQPLRALGTVETNASGYFALILTPDLLARLAEAAPSGAFLTVGSPKGTVIHQHPAVLRPQGGDRLTVEITLDRTDLGTGPVCPPTEPPVEPPVKKDWVVRGQVVEAKTGRAIASVQVNAIDNNRRFDDKLGSAITDDKGMFRIAYDFQSPAGAVLGPDLYVTVIDESGKQLFSSQSDLRRNAGREEEFKIAIAPTPGNPEPPNLPLDGSLIWFETGSTKLRQDDERLNGDRLIRLALRRAQGFLQENPNGQFALHGYASTAEGSREEALALSQKRAELVRQALVQLNIPAAQVSVNSHGINAVYAEVQLNQRVEIVMSPGLPVVDRPIVDRPIVDRPVGDRPIVDRGGTRPIVNRGNNPGNPERS